MTAIVRLAINKYPLLIGDLLLSAPESVGIRVAVPTVDDLSTVFPKGSGFTPSGLRQKITVIGDDLAIGWAGSGLAAGSIIKGLVERYRQEPLTYDSTKDYFESVDESVWAQGVGFLGFVKDFDRVRHFGVNCKNLQTELFGDVGFLGSGTESVEKYLRQLSLLPLSPGRTGNVLTQSVLSALSLCGSLLSSEIESHSSLYEYFGAGYEIAGLVEGKFKKIDDITYLFWRAQTDGQRVRIPFPHRSFKVSYLGDILVIRVDTIKPVAGGAEMSFETSCNFVSPVYRHVARQELDGFVPPSMNSKFMCNFFMFHDRMGKPTVLTAAACVGQEGPSIKFIEEGWSAKQFAIKDSYIEEIADRIREQF